VTTPREPQAQPPTASREAPQPSAALREAPASSAPPAARQPVRLPPGPPLPKPVQGMLFLASRRGTMRALRRRYGRSYSIHVPIFGSVSVISEPALVKQLFLTSTEFVGNMEVNLGRVLGEGSLFNLDGAAHHRQRKLLIPPFHGKRMHTYETIVEEETRREAATWPDGEPFETLPSMMRITLNVILRAVFGAEGAEFEALRRLMPRFVALGSRLAVLPVPHTDLGRWSPWGRFNAYRREFDAIVDRLIAKAQSDQARADQARADQARADQARADQARADPELADRGDVLSIMLQARYDDGERMTNRQIADQLTTLLAAGHETTATTLAWAIERLRRHPGVLARLAAEADAAGTDPAEADAAGSDFGADESRGALRQATILEVQRVRPVIDLTARRVKADSLPLGQWVFPRGHTIMVGIGLVHSDDTVFPDADRFDPERFVGVKPDRYAWVPFGGGFRRCLGAAFADMEMNVVLATLLREFEIVPTTEPGERWHSRGVAYAPAKGGVAVVHRRPPLVGQHTTGQHTTGQHTTGQHTTGQPVTATTQA
jgi:cytochrome P450 family 138